MSDERGEPSGRGSTRHAGRVRTLIARVLTTEINRQAAGSILAPGV
jgi:hypothetical protein